MGTNYYLHQEVCSHCGRSDEPLHIGKSSGGWCFSLNTHEGIEGLNDWQEAWSKPGSVIKDEYGSYISADVMMANITARSREKSMSIPYGYASWSDFYAMNHAEPGPRNLIRHKVDGTHCIGHGDGTYDLFRGEFF